jgi:hypothetical protein
VVTLQFGSGEAAHHLVLELYSGGNIILTDHAHSVLTLLRSYKDENKGVCIMPNHLYQAQAGQPLATSPPDLAAVATALKEGEGKKVKDVLGGLVPYGPAVTEHVTLTVGLTGSTPFTAELNTPALVCAARHAPRSLPSLSLSRAQGAPRLEREAVDPIVYSCRHRKAGAGGRSGRHHTHLRRRFREGVLNGERGGGRWRRCTRRWGTCTRGC